MPAEAMRFSVCVVSQAGPIVQTIFVCRNARRSDIGYQAAPVCLDFSGVATCCPLLAPTGSTLYEFHGDVDAKAGSRRADRADRLGLRGRGRLCSAGAPGLGNDRP